MQFFKSAQIFLGPEEQKIRLLLWLGRFLKWCLGECSNRILAKKTWVIYEPLPYTVNPSFVLATN